MAIKDTYTEQEVSFTWEANLFLYAKIQDKMEGEIDLKRRHESFQDWLDILKERNQITDEQYTTYKYVGKEEF